MQQQADKCVGGDAGGAAAARDDWMTKVAVLGRGSPLTALPLLSNLISHREQQAAHAITLGHSVNDTTLSHAWQRLTLTHCLTLTHASHFFIALTFTQA